MTKNYVKVSWKKWS